MDGSSRDGRPTYGLLAAGRHGENDVRRHKGRAADPERVSSQQQTLGEGTYAFRADALEAHDPDGTVSGGRRTQRPADRGARAAHRDGSSIAATDEGHPAQRAVGEGDIEHGTGPRGVRGSTEVPDEGGLCRCTDVSEDAREAAGQRRVVVPRLDEDHEGAGLLALEAGRGAHHGQRHGVTQPFPATIPGNYSCSRTVRGMRTALGPFVPGPFARILEYPVRTRVSRRPTSGRHRGCWPRPV